MYLRGPPTVTNVTYTLQIFGCTETENTQQASIFRFAQLNPKQIAESWLLPKMYVRFLPPV